MKDRQNNLNADEALKTSAIFFTAAASSAIAYSTSLLYWMFWVVVRGGVNLHERWMSHSHSLLSWLASASFLCTLALGLLISPFILAIVLPLHFFKTNWLPKDDPALIHLLEYWANLVLYSFALVCLAQLLENLGAI